MIKNSISPRIERGMTKLVVPHEGKSIAVAFPSFGPDTYINVGREILNAGQKVLVGDYAASLVHSAYCDDSVKDEPEFENIRNIMINGWISVFNRNLWTPEGVYVVQDLKAIGRSEKLDSNELEKALKGGKELSWGGIRFSRDGKVRFAPKGSYVIGKQISESLAKNGFVIAGHGIEEAEKLGEVSSTLRFNPYVLGLNIEEGEEPETSVSALYGNYGNELHVIGYFDDDNHGRSFGVLT